MMTDQRPVKIGGYADGSYLCLCCLCNNAFAGDKRAIACLPCAAENAEEKIASLTSQVEELTGALAAALNLSSYPFVVARDGSVTLADVKKEAERDSVSS